MALVSSEILYQQVLLGHGAVLLSTVQHRSPTDISNTKVNGIRVTHDGEKSGE